VAAAAAPGAGWASSESTRKQKRQTPKPRLMVPTFEYV
jgi:hypothetical protein